MFTLLYHFGRRFHAKNMALLLSYAIWNYLGKIYEATHRSILGHHLILMNDEAENVMRSATLAW